MFFENEENACRLNFPSLNHIDIFLILKPTNHIESGKVAVQSLAGTLSQAMQ